MSGALEGEIGFRNCQGGKRDKLLFFFPSKFLILSLIKCFFPQFVVIHTVKGFGIVNKAEVDFFFSETLLLFAYPVVVGNFISGSSAFSNPL